MTCSMNRAPKSLNDEILVAEMPATFIGMLQICGKGGDSSSVSSSQVDAKLDGACDCGVAWRLNYWIVIPRVADYCCGLIELAGTKGQVRFGWVKANLALSRHSGD